MAGKLVVSIRFTQPPVAVDVVVKVINSTVGAVFGTLRTNLVRVAFGPTRVICKIGKRDIRWIASPEIVDDARQDICRPSGCCICVGDVCRLEKKATRE